uniref:Serine beta-lactamase-like protein LACTB, mitochondrial n=1 Tax=Dermatophagoides pteronyssinus TaxID=6956 RepID=A0A6P6Y895_DERPT|nr:serine beta-lactamase-like protein LACTB, mitochondrial [Dermatophagoides pteronyssinus]
MNVRQTWKTLGWITFGSLSTYGFLNQYPDYISLKKRQKNIESIIKSQDNNDQILEKNPVKNIDVVVVDGNDRTEKLYSDAIRKSRQRLLQWKTEQTVPGFVIGISVRGRPVWIEGQGYADIENNVRCHRDTIMRIASISKSITATMLAKMVEDRKIDLDNSIYNYLNDGQFPRKQWQNEQVDITVRQLAAHLSGIRTYKEEETDKTKTDFDCPEVYQKDYFSSVTDSLRLFKDDPLVVKPGTKFHYSTYDYTLLAAVMENQMETKNFAKEFQKFIRNELGLLNTYLDQNDQIIYNRSRYYYRDTKKPNNGQIQNVPYVDNSYKWSGGGLLSNVPDLLQFGNLLLYSYLGTDPINGRKGYLQRSTVDEMWKPLENSSPNWQKDKSRGYGLGFSVIRNGHENCRAFAAEPPFNNVAMHTGGAVGASSLLLIEPDSEIVVAIIVNLQHALPMSLINDIVKLFSTTAIEKKDYHQKKTN